MKSAAAMVAAVLVLELGLISYQNYRIHRDLSELNKNLTGFRGGLKGIGVSV